MDESEYEKDIELDPDKMEIPAISEDQMLVQLHLGTCWHINTTLNPRRKTTLEIRPPHS